MDDRVHCRALSSKHTQLKVTGFKAFSSVWPASILIFFPVSPLCYPSLSAVWHIQCPISLMSYHLGVFLMFFLLTWRILTFLSAWLNLLLSTLRSGSNSLHWFFFFPIPGQKHFSLLWPGMLIIHAHLAITKSTRQYLCFSMCFSTPGRKS